MGDLARRLPQSPPGTLFGIPLARLREPSLQRSVLLIAGIALLASVVVPVSLSPLIFSWDLHQTFRLVVWPILVGAAYLFLTLAPDDVRRNVPPVVLQWLPFGLSFASILIVKAGAEVTVLMANMSLMAKDGIERVEPSTREAIASISDLAWVFALGYAVLTFGLLARLAQSQDTVARIVIGIGAGLLLPMYVQTFKFAFVFKPNAFFGLHNVLFLVVMTLAVACLVFLIPPRKVPALEPVDAFAPHITAVLLAWLPVQVVLMFVSFLVEAKGKDFFDGLLGVSHLLLPLVAYFGVLMITAPAAYDEAKAAIQRSRAGGPPPGGGPPGGYGPPPGGGYPPPGGGWPPVPPSGAGPQGGGYPPPGGYSPPGGSYPPPDGGGWPRQ